MRGVILAGSDAGVVCGLDVRGAGGSVGLELISVMTCLCFLEFTYCY